MNQVHDRREQTNADDVIRWRAEQLLRAGYSRDDASMLAGRRDVDLHLATRLLASGCPQETALRILL
jgi:hypothetical protein